MSTKITPDKLHQMSKTSVNELRRICQEEGDTEGVKAIEKYTAAMAELNRRMDAKNNK